MNITSKVTVQGIDEAFASQLNSSLELIDDVLKDAANVVYQDAKASQAFKDQTKTYRKSIGKRKSKFKDGGYIVFSKDRKAHLLEFGHIKVLWGKRTNDRVQPFPVFRPALAKGISFLRGKIS